MGSDPTDGAVFYQDGCVVEDANVTHLAARFERLSGGADGDELFDVFQQELHRS